MEFYPPRTKLIPESELPHASKSSYVLTAPTLLSGHHHRIDFKSYLNLIETAFGHISNKLYVDLASVTSFFTHKSFYNMLVPSRPTRNTILNLRQ